MADDSGDFADVTPSRRGASSPAAARLIVSFDAAARRRRRPRQRASTSPRQPARRLFLDPGFRGLDADGTSRRAERQAGLGRGIRTALIQVPPST